jgi:hypothetical protein
MLTYRKYATFHAFKNCWRKESSMITIACSETPDGIKKWTYQLLANRLIELKIFDHIGITQLTVLTPRSVMRR